MAPIAASHTEDQDQAALLQQKLQPEAVVSQRSDYAPRSGLRSQLFSTLGYDQDPHDDEYTLDDDTLWAIEEQSPRAPAIQGTSKMSTSEGSNQAIQLPSQDTLTNAALVAIRHFKDAFLQFTEPLLQADLEEFTHDVWHEFYNLLRSQEAIAKDAYPSTVSSGERIDFSFTRDFETVANRLLASQQFFTTDRLNGFVRGYGRRWQRVQQANGQAPIAPPPTTFAQYVTAQGDSFYDVLPGSGVDPANQYAITRGDFYDSAQGSGSDPTNPNDASDKEPQETIDPALRYV
ncbi:uncharacterized protein BDZ99DRAFT_456572 [Mytilinidion resinicola]|uniref:Uncharacterized protein n=1 Tax=Mytilinidion resinicola TaxID=574789 RepID=A0A6A6Z6N9_9PEZI|nr:uncharacterized protein BDZ99DRAFT_456572 [Mytilinidion resinicola]KAF2816756.1 hypothetical protein BDZ99DRAFT_456572 [Mytilinidion resinicola]